MLRYVMYLLIFIYKSPPGWLYKNRQVLIVTIILILLNNKFSYEISNDLVRVWYKCCSSRDYPPTHSRWGILETAKRNNEKKDRLF
jgi:hypothetical protein